LSIAFDSPLTRPSRSEIEPVAADLIRRRGSEVLGVARRYAVSPEDAEDAYQRGLEILLTKAPTTQEAELLPWLKTVVRHEAFALRKKRERDVPAEHEALDAFVSDLSHAAEERAERYDRLRVGAEALGRLKPQETRALLLKAEGLSYQEIAAQTGWTYTKVNRCLVEGRRAFVARVEGIESGEECERMQPLLSAFADGEASAEDVATLRPHLRGCSSCRAALRDYREAPRKVAAVVPAGGLLAWLADRVWSGVRSLFEGAAAQKIAVVAASSAAVAGGGAATMQAVDHTPARPAAQRAAAASRPAATPRTAPMSTATPATTAKRTPQRRHHPRRRAPAATQAQRSPAPSTRPSRASAAPAPKQTSPSSNPATAPAAAPAAPTKPDPKPAAAPAGDGGGEFGP